MYKFLFKQIDNSSLIVFRIIFGLLCFLESVGAIATGWVKKNMVDPQFTFSFIGFDWLQPLPDNWMYIYYTIMGLFGLLIMIGYKYRFSIITFTLMWTASYLMQKSSYNNHYYLLMLLSAIMIFLPAHCYASIDSKLKPKLKRTYMHNWCRWLIITLLFIIYTYAAIAKLYPDWLNFTFVTNLMKNRSHFPVVGAFIQQPWFIAFLTYGGIVFDGLVIPLLLFKPTRKFAFLCALFFHLFNSFVLHIGIFPYLALAFSVFFFNSKTIQSVFLRSKTHYNSSEVSIPKHAKFISLSLIIFLGLNVLLPLRHHFFEDDVLWTEEGHRLSWRMMLRSKSGTVQFTIINKKTKEKTLLNLNNYLTPKQKQKLSTKPDMLWQFAQRLKKEFKSKGDDIAVFAKVFVSVNGKPKQQFINPNTDLANESWHHFKHHDWILPSK